MKHTLLALLGLFSGLLAPAAPTPAALAGTWGLGTSTSTINYQNRNTGSFSGPSGRQVQYEFLPDGRFTYSDFYQQSFYGCTTQLFLYRTGTVKYEGTSLTLVPSTGSFSSKDTCNKQYNYEKPADKPEQTFRWSIESDEAAERLCMDNGKEKNCFKKR